MKNIYELVEVAKMKWPDYPAIHEDAGTLHFSELADLCEQLKSELIEKGVSKGLGIGVMMKNSSGFIISLLASVGANAVVMPISHQLKKSELDDCIRQTGIHFILDDFSGIDPELHSPQLLQVGISKMRLSSTASEKNNAVAPHVPDAAFIRFTSGTTGKSKGVIVSHQSTFERIEAANKALNLGPGDTVVWVLPMAFHFLVSIILYIRFGAAITICKDFLAATIIRATNQYKGTLLYASPMHIRLLANDKSDEQMPSLNRVISTSTAISPAFCEAFKVRFGTDVSQAYGIIEIGLPIINFKKSAEHPDAVGHALPDYRVEMLSENYEILPPNNIGKLAIQGPGMFDAYLSPAQMRDEILVKQFFLTGDLAVKSVDGLITVCGREKSMINVSGNKVFPEEVEHVLLAHPDIKECRVFGTTHPLLGEIVQAAIVLHSGKSLETEILLDFCRQRLSTYKVPQQVTFVDKLDFTTSGKIKRA